VATRRRISRTTSSTESSLAAAAASCTMFDLIPPNSPSNVAMHPTIPRTRSEIQPPTSVCIS
jgi:hypothetical protein